MSKSTRKTTPEVDQGFDAQTIIDKRQNELQPSCSLSPFVRSLYLILLDNMHRRMAVPMWQELLYACA